MHPIKFWLNPTYGLGDIVWRISRWPPLRHLGYRNGTILAILNLYFPAMPPIKFQFNPNYGLERDVVWRISRYPTWRPSWISERNYFNKPESLCHSDASNQVRLNLTYGLGGDVVWRTSWISEWSDFSNSESLCHCDAFHQVSAQFDLRFGRRKCLKNFKIAAMAAILDIGTERF